MELRNTFTMCRLCLSENQCFINIFEFNDWQGYNASEVISNLLQFQPVIKQEELDIDSSGDGSEYPFEGTNTEEMSFGPMPLKHEVLSFNKYSHPEHSLVDRVAHPQYVQCLQHKRPHCTIGGGVDSDPSTRNMSTDDASLLAKSENIPLSVEVEASSCGTMAEGQWIIPEERIFTVPHPQWDVGRGKEGEKVKEEDDTGEGCTAAGKGVEGETERFKCYHCGNLSMTKRDLIRHMKVHGFGNSYDCDVCGRLFKSNRELKRHVFTHSGTKVYKCAECDKSFRRRDNLKLHMRSHTGLKPYKCAECSKSFSRNSYLNKHMKIHTGTKSYTCAECHKGFRLNSHLKRHMNSHTGAKPYKCTECSKCFRDNSILKIHMRTHTDCRPYKCSICSKCFGRNSILKIHLRSHMGFRPYKCAECSKCFSQNCDLNTHMRTHTGSKAYKCA